MCDNRFYRQVSFAGHRSLVAGRRSHQNQKAISNTGNVIITRDNKNVSLYNFNEKFLGVVQCICTNRVEI